MFSVFDEKFCPAPAVVDGRRIGLTRSQLFRRAKVGFRRHVPPPMIPWMEQNVRFPSTWEHTRFDLLKAPHVRGVIDRFWLKDQFRKANLPWAVRSAKTSTMQAIIAYCAACDPQPMAILFPTQKLLEDSLASHLYPMFSQIGVIRRQLPPPSRRNTKSIEFGSCRARLANAGTVADSSGYPAPRIFKVEHEKCPRPKSGSAEADSSRRIESRAIAYTRGVKIMEEGSPAERTVSRAIVLLENKDVVQFRYVVPCPHCNVYQQLYFDREHFVIEKLNGEWNAGHAMKHSHYKCDHCKGKILDHHRAKMMQSGEWIGQGEWMCPVTNQLMGSLSVDSDTCVFGEYSILYSLFVKGWGDIGQLWVKAIEAQRSGDIDALKTFTTEFLAQVWDDTPRRADVDALAVHLKGTHDKGKVPDHAAFITTAVDIGCVDNELIFHWQTVAWWQGRKGAVVDWGAVVGVDAWMKFCDSKSFKFQGDDERSLPMKDFPIGIDSGKYTTEVYAIADMIQNAVAIKGDSRSADAKAVDDYYGGNRKTDQSAAVLAVRKKLGIFDLCFINSDKTQRWRDAHVGMRLQGDWGGFVWLPRDVCEAPHNHESFFNQIRADYFMNGKWERSGDNEAGDCLRYNYALGQRYTDNGERWKTVRLAARYAKKVVRTQPVVRRASGHVQGRSFKRNFLATRN